MKAAAHPNQTARLAALRRYNILDTPRESDFDDIVRLAARICGTPISVVNLIDAERQWFKAETGLGVRETPLETSLCAHVILEDSFVEIPDTLDDPRMCDNPLCLADQGLRFYAGALLHSPDGQPIGTLCVLDYQPRRLDAFQKEALQTLAAQVMAQLDLRAVVAREAILRTEIDHRIKNSLQMVGGFVALQRVSAENEAVRSALLNVEQQISTVAILHDLLGRHGDGEPIDIAPYMARVVELLDATTPERIRVLGTFDPGRVRPEDGAVLGTIVNELVSNALKHSLIEASGAIRLSGERLDGGAYRLICADDGGAPQPATPPNGRVGLGLSIIRASVQHLAGTMTVTADANGYRTQIDFTLAP